VAWWWRRRKPEHACSNIPRLDAGPGSASIDKPAHFFSGIVPEPLAFILSLGNRCLCCLPAQSFASLLSVLGLFYFSASLFAFFFTVRRVCWNSLLHFVQLQEPPLLHTRKLGRRKALALPFFQMCPQESSGAIRTKLIIQPTSRL